MMLLEIVLVLAALLGHAVVWTGVNNRLHATPLRRSHLKAISALAHLGTVVIPLVFAWWIFRERLPVGQWHTVVMQHPTVLFYVLFCTGIAAVHVPRWLYVRFVTLRAAAAHGRRLMIFDAVERLGMHPTRGLQFAVGRRAPFNQVMQVEFTEKQAPLARLPSQLDGLRIAHLSDLHLSGRVLPEFFHELVREINALQPDLVLLSGDVCDKASCLPWIDDILSPVAARYGKFFILGNHDDRLEDIAGLRAAISATGFVDLGGCCQRISIAGEEVLLAGNERPWFPAVACDADLQPSAARQEGVRILLSHSPDQVRWARRHNFDLMLSGHTHGGQIRFPLVGPVVCPSWYGVRYASGLFLEKGLTVHVCRGVSGLFPIRWNCMPEVTILELRSRR